MDQDYIDRWEALLKEYDAKADRLEAELRLKYNNAFDDLNAEFQAVTDWSEATWEEFAAKAERRWQELTSSDAT